MSTMFNRCGAKRRGKGTKQTQSTSSTSANTYGYTTPPDTADMEALRTHEFTHDPRIPYAFARQRQNMASSYANPLGGATTPQLRDAALRAGYEDSAQNEAQALREESHGLQGLQYAAKQSLAGMTAPRLIQTGGTSSGTGTSTIQQPFMDSLNPFVQGGASLGSAAILA